MVGLKGGKWTGKLTFVSYDAKNPSNTVEVKISPEDLAEKLQECGVDLEEEILDMEQWRSDLEGSPNPVMGFRFMSFDYYLYHEFIVFETTNKWMWSIEKNLQGIILQRSKDCGDASKQLLNKARKHPGRAPMSDSFWFDDNYVRAISWRGRRGLRHEEQDVRSLKIKDLVDWLQSGEHISQDRKYHFLLDNCQSFANLFWNDFSKTGRLRKLLGARDDGSFPIKLYKCICWILTAALVIVIDYR
jgi:hypothetical protein